MINIYWMNFCAKVLNSVQIYVLYITIFIRIKGYYRVRGCRNFSMAQMLYMN